NRSARYAAARPREARDTRVRPARLRFAAAGTEVESQFHLSVREWTADPRPPSDARAIFCLSQPHAGRVLSVCAAIPRLRLRGGGCKCPPFEDRGPFPARVVR